MQRFGCAVAGYVALAGVATAASTAAMPPARTLASYCSASGDICYGIFSRSRVVLLKISSAARYFSRYTLCVDAPGGGAAGSIRCGSFPMFRQAGSTWGSTVRHARQFPVAGGGVYRVTWKLNGTPLGPSLRFRLPLPR